MLTSHFWHCKLIKKSKHSKHKRVGRLLAYDLPMHGPEECNEVIDGSMFLVRLGMSLNEKAQCNVLNPREDLEQIVLICLANASGGGGLVRAGSLNSKRPRMLTQPKKGKQVLSSTCT